MIERSSQLNVLGGAPAGHQEPQVKPSRFNVYRTVGSRTAIFNTLSGQWVVLGAMATHLFKAGKTNLLSERDRERLMAIDALVAVELDEDSVYRYLHQKAIHDTKTLSVVVGLTFHCNLACPYCFEDGTELQRMSDETLDRVILAIQRKCTMESTRELRVMLFGGEPLLEVERGRTLLAQLSAWAHRHGVKFEGSMATNATLATSDRIAPLAPYINHAMVAFDGPRPKHDLLRVASNKKPTFDKIVEGIRVLLAHEIKVVIRVQASSPDEVPVLLADLANQGFTDDPRIRFMFTIRQQFLPCGETCNAEAETIDPRSQAAQQIHSIAPGALPLDAPVAQIVSCVVVGNTYCIAPDGQIYNCIAELGRDDRAVGRITDDGWFRTDSRILEWTTRDPLEFASCRECQVLPQCGGGCNLHARNEHGDMRKGNWCGPHKTVLHARIDRMLEAKLGGGQTPNTGGIE
jgi:uncharacterized protein